MYIVIIWGEVYCATRILAHVPFASLNIIVRYSYVEMLTKEDWLHLKSGELTSVGVGWKIGNVPHIWNDWHKRLMGGRGVVLGVCPSQYYPGSRDNVIVWSG